MTNPIVLRKELQLWQEPKPGTHKRATYVVSVVGLNGTHQNLNGLHRFERKRDRAEFITDLSVSGAL